MDLTWLDEGLELGRSFFQPRYWGSRSLDYLWQGIGAYYVRHPEIRYLFGIDRKTAYKTMKMHLREMSLAVPTLLKHYSELCKNGGVMFTDFGVDPYFGDGFVIVDFSKIKASKKSRYLAPFLEQLEAKVELEVGIDLDIS